MGKKIGEVKKKQDTKEEERTLFKATNIKEIEIEE